MTTEVPRDILYSIIPYIKTQHAKMQFAELHQLNYLYVIRDDINHLVENRDKEIEYNRALIEKITKQEFIDRKQKLSIKCFEENIHHYQNNFNEAVVNWIEYFNNMKSHHVIPPTDQLIAILEIVHQFTPLSYKSNFISKKVKPNPNILDFLDHVTPLTFYQGFTIRCNTNGNTYHNDIADRLYNDPRFVDNCGTYYLENINSFNTMNPYIFKIILGHKKLELNTRYMEILSSFLMITTYLEVQEMIKILFQQNDFHLMDGLLILKDNEEMFKMIFTDPEIYLSDRMDWSYRDYEIFNQFFTNHLLIPSLNIVMSTNSISNSEFSIGIQQLAFRVLDSENLCNESKFQENMKGCSNIYQFLVVYFKRAENLHQKVPKKYMKKWISYQQFMIQQVMLVGWKFIQSGRRYEDLSNEHEQEYRYDNEYDPDNDPNDAREAIIQMWRRSRW
jgi:hypothetical protein